MCLDGCKKGFLGSYKPFIGVDGCHLKTSYGGQLLVAIGRDPNDQYFPLAFAMVENECKDTWRWFLTQLLDDIGGIDYQSMLAGINVSFRRYLEWSGTQDVFTPFVQKLQEKFGGGLLIRDLMMGAAKATYYKEWEKNGCDVLINNLSESFNSTILLARDKPIITMIGWIRSYIMSRFASLREKVDTYPGDVMPKPRKRLDREVEKSGNWLPVWAGGSQFEVTHGFTMDKFVVDLSNHTCAYYFRDLVGIPCRHVVVAIHYKLENLEHYFHPYYKKDAYRTCHAPIITPINGQQLWPTSDSPQLLPPIYKTPLGRPKKLRRREANEYVSHSKLSKKNIAMRCSTCNAYGHNVRSCKKS
ncbi:uncharacterized protein LOC106770077 [Vigna radiata var. radiata]|uniref:Uncharacterized protein LOC106770077 n=1 Tax=Vigna radiata var. radiata TaxID=3916 RepID=A0A1S3UZ77_VIGRR|nr:uncharacterized protein LOC106770077 [Vigna radiata var. radiata]